MGIFEELQNELEQLELSSAHHGYWYKISDMLTIMICGMLCHLQTIDNIHEWAVSSPSRAFFKERFGIDKMPCRAQFYNILSCVDSENFGILFTNWAQRTLCKDISGKTIAIDGKTICSTEKLNSKGNALHIASAIISEQGLVIGSRECNSKIEEPAAFRELIEILDVSGTVVVADALHCNKKSAQAVVEKGADYLFVVKDNHPSMKEDIALYVQNESMETFSHVEKNGGRIEKRTGFVTHDIEWLNRRNEWKNILTIGAIRIEFQKGNKKSSEWHYYISSAKLNAQDLLRHARLEWQVESMHWLLDVHFAEDKTHVWNMNVQKTLNHMRKIALNLAKVYKNENKSKLPISGILKRNLFDLTCLDDFLWFFS